VQVRRQLENKLCISAGIGNKRSTHLGPLLHRIGSGTSTAHISSSISSSSSGGGGGGGGGGGFGKRPLHRWLSSLLDDVLKTCLVFL
jgi:hypothetical protein